VSVPVLKDNDVLKFEIAVDNTHLMKSHQTRSYIACENQLVPEGKGPCFQKGAHASKGTKLYYDIGKRSVTFHPPAVSNESQNVGMLGQWTMIHDRYLSEDGLKARTKGLLTVFTMIDSNLDMLDGDDSAFKFGFADNEGAALTNRCNLS
jgi:hypothetical protein